MRIVPLLLFIFILFPSTLSSQDYTKKYEVRQFIKNMHKEYNYNKAYLTRIFGKVRDNPQMILKKTKKSKTKKKTLPQGEWDRYARMHLKYSKTALGVKFMRKHRTTLKRAYKKYGVPPEYITAIIGIESHYGKNRGTYYVFDRLTHLAFNKGKRKKFYKYQLQEFLRMCFREQVEPRRVKGSSSGAIGLAQFMPSNYKSLAVDFNNDGKIRISQAQDAIGSIGNYFKESGWKRNEPVSTRVSYEGNRFFKFKTGYEHKYHRNDLTDIKPRKHFPYAKKVMLIKLQKEQYDELWYGANNFYVITRYNHSSYYAMAVHQLAQRIKKAYAIKHTKK